MNKFFKKNILKYFYILKFSIFAAETQSSHSLDNIVFSEV